MPDIHDADSEKRSSGLVLDDKVILNLLSHSEFYTQCREFVSLLRPAKQLSAKFQEMSSKGKCRGCNAIKLLSMQRQLVTLFKRHFVQLHTAGKLDALQRVRQSVENMRRQPVPRLYLIGQGSRKEPKRVLIVE